MRIDPHSYADDSQPIIQKLTWKGSVDFTRRVIYAKTSLDFEAPGSGPLDLDTRGLHWP